MKIQTPALIAACAPACLFAGMAQAANITSLNVGDAAVNYPTSPATGSSSANRAAGHTVNATITLDAADTTGSVVLFEYGGTSNGFNVGLVDGVLTYVASHNGGDADEPTSLNDTELRVNGGPGNIAVQSSFGALTAGTEYSVAVSWDQNGNLQLGVQDATTGTKDAIAITGGWDNWSGNNSYGIGQVHISAGGYSSELAENGDATLAAVDASYLQNFAGTIGDLQYWNAAGDISVVPEPASLALVGMGSLALVSRRRRSR